MIKARASSWRWVAAGDGGKRRRGTYRRSGTESFQDMSTESIALCRMANDLHQQGRHSEALAAYDRAIELNPCYPAALNNRGVALLALSQPAKALESFEKVGQRYELSHYA